MIRTTTKDIQQVVKNRREVLTIDQNATIVEVATKMSDNNVGCLLVIDNNGKCAGVLTERDMLSGVFTKETSYAAGVLVKDIMTTDPISCTTATSIERIEQLMAEHKIRHLPIIENEVPVGMLSSRDLIAYRLRTSKAMRTAAEQLALLSTKLKSLNLDDVADLATNEVPDNFAAQRAVLCFPPKGSSAAIIYRTRCPLGEKQMMTLADSIGKPENDEISYPELTGHPCTCDPCTPKLVIPLAIHEQDTVAPEHSIESLHPNIIEADEEPGEQRRLRMVPMARKGFLCMCHFDTSALESNQLQFYKASLLKELLSANLTTARIYQDYRQARRDSEIDPLTDVCSRRVLRQALRTEYERATRYERPFSVAIVDIDNFKKINDSAGHAAGDKALRKVAKIMRRSARRSDMIIIRYGGDEFVLLMPETKLNAAAVLLERLRRQIRKISISQIDTITVSCGVAEWSGMPDEGPENILSRADEALYRAKDQGRDCVITSNGIPQISDPQMISPIK